MRVVRLGSDDWSHEPVLCAEGFMERLMGLHMVDPGSSILLETSSVHAIGFRKPFRAVALSDEHVVMDVRIVVPWTAAFFRGCRYVLELPVEIDPPAPGARLEVTGA